MALYPVGAISDVALGGAVLTGGATLTAVWSDLSDASYATLTNGDIPQVNMLNFVPNGNERLIRYRVVVRSECMTPSNVGNPLTYQVLLGATTINTEGLCSAAVAGIQDVISGWNFVPASTAFSGISLQWNVTTADTWRVYRTYLEVETVDIAQINFIAPSGIIFNRSPVIGWTYSQSQQVPISRARVLIFTEAVAGQPNFDPLVSEFQSVYRITAEQGIIPTGTGFFLPNEYDEAYEAPVTRQTSGTQPYDLTGQLLPGNYRAYLIYDLTVSGGSVFDLVPPTFASFTVADFQLPSAKESTLGCGEWDAFLALRGGNIIQQLRATSINLSREVDNYSSATVVLATGEISEKCCETLNALTPWEHELILTRNGNIEWVGPFVDYKENAEQGAVTLTARDLFAWMDKRVLPFSRDLFQTDLASIFSLYVFDALYFDDSMEIVLASSGTGVLGDRSVKATDRKYAGDALRELARSGVDITMMGRTMLVGGAALGLTPLYVSDAFGSVDSVSVNGLDMASNTFVLGAGGGPQSAPIQGEAGGFQTRLGLVQKVYSESNIKDDASALAAAESRLAMVSVPLIECDVSLNSTAPIPFEDLVAGRTVQVQAGAAVCKQINQTMRMKSVKIRASGTGDEVVILDLIPIGTES